MVNRAVKNKSLRPYYRSLAEKLMLHGMSPGMPAAIIERGTMPEQRVLITTVGDLPATAVCGNIKAPAMVIIGEVVCLHRRLAWYHPVGSSPDNQPTEDPE